MNNRLLLDQMLDADVAEALNQQGFPALQASNLPNIHHSIRNR